MPHCRSEERSLCRWVGAQGWKPLDRAAYRGAYAPETSYTNHSPRLLPRAPTLCRCRLRRRNRHARDLHEIG